MTTALERLAGGWGRVVGAYRAAIQQRQRPAFLGAQVQAARWEGGIWYGQEQAVERRAMTNSWVYSAISLIAKEASAAQFQVMRTGGPDDKPEQIQNHPLEVLLRRPNPFMSRSFLWQYSIWWLKLDGNFYWYLGAGNGGLAEIWPLPAYQIRAIPGDAQTFVSHYEYTVGGQVFQIPANLILHVKQPNPWNIFTGLSELVAATLPSDSDLAMSRWNGAFFAKDNVMPSSIINLSSGTADQPINPSDADALKADLQDDYSAFRRKSLVTTANSVTAMLLGWNAKDMDFITGRKFEKEEIFTIYGIPGGLVDPNATEANAFVAQQGFKERTIWPLLCMIADWITIGLVMPYYGDGLEAAFEDIRPVNRELQLAERDAAKGVLTIDEIRQRYFEVPPLPNGQGAVLEGIGGFGGLGGLGGFEQPGNPAEGLTQSHQAAQQELRRWKSKALRALKSGKAANVNFDSDYIADDVADHIREHLTNAKTADDVRAAFEVAADPSPFSLKVIRPFRPWSRLEAEMQRQVQAALDAEARRLVAELRKTGPGALEAAETWAEHERRLLAAIQGPMGRLAAFGVERVRRTLTAGEAINVNWGLANQRAVDWALSHAAERARLLSDTTRKMIANAQTKVEDIYGAVSEWAAQPEALPDLVRRIEQIVPNPVRAEMIAVTESTSTFADANSAAWAEVGYAPAVYKPAYHIRCRCYVQPYKLPNGEKVIVNYTAVDELVCTQELETPWGETVEGCRALHMVVLSEGDYLGMKLSDAIELSKEKRL